MRRTLLLVMVGGCNLYFGEGEPASNAPPDAGPTSVALARECLRAMAPLDLTVGATTSPHRLFITYVCEGGAITETIKFDGATFAGGDARGDFQDSADRLIPVAFDGKTPSATMMISAHRPELWLFTYGGGARTSFGRAFDDLWLGDADLDGTLDYVLAGDNAVRIASATDPTYGYPLDVPASSEHQVLGGKPFHHVALTNLIGDARPDLFYVAGGSGAPFELGLAEQSGPQIFAVVESSTESSASAATSQPLRVADVDGDALPDVVGTTSRLFVRSSRYQTTLFLEESVRAFAIGDLDADGSAEIVYVTADGSATRRAMVTMLSGTPGLSSAPLISEGGDLVEAVDLDADAHADVILIRDARKPSSTLAIHRGSTF